MMMMMGLTFWSDVPEEAWGQNPFFAAQAGICALEVFNFLKSELHSVGSVLFFCPQV